MTGDQLSIDDALSFPSEPIAGDTRATVGLVANDWLHGDGDYARFEAVCRAVSRGGVVDPNKVRAYLTHDGISSIAPRRLSAFWARATAKNGFMDNTAEWTVNEDHKGGNAGKPIRLRKLREAS